MTAACKTTTLLQEVGLSVPTVLLPQDGVDMAKWAVVACDQFTSQPEYWETVAETVGDAPSTLNLILPEVYLESAGVEERIEAINTTMVRYVEDGTLAAREPGFVLLDRSTPHAASRKGLVVALDLEQYDYRSGSETLIRATEGTILDRLPPRVKVRERAPVELPHIMVLIDDPEKTVIEPLCEAELAPLYDFDLMMNGGHVTGALVADKALQAQVGTALSRLADPERIAATYGTTVGDVLLYAMGDGNHSFATAKAIWETLKKENGGLTGLEEHPARHALVELVNLHDEGLQFEPIHRVLFGVDAKALFAEMKTFFAAQGSTVTCECFATPAQATHAAEASVARGVHAVPYVTEQGVGVVNVQSPSLTLVVATLQAFLDAYLAENAEVRIDYIHGEETLIDLGARPGNIGFFLPAIDKQKLFPTILNDGALPRKTFSMGEAEEKRYYLECRRIRS